jgi:serine/threonine protein kinase
LLPSTRRGPRVQQLGKYEIISEIGRGAMGSVYKARDPLINRLVALKTITGGPSAQANLLDRFYQEARSAGALQHPSIVTIYELGHEKNTPFIAMEFLEGESLDRIIEQRPVLPLSVKLGYIVRVCEALAYAHQHNVVHRDIKPGNIMVTKEGVVKVVDFGIARLTDMSMTQPNMMIGSRAYMSPQQYKGEKADARSDIWALGVTLHELLAYQRPFAGDSEAELMFHIIYEDPPNLQGLASDCTEELASVVKKMLEKKIEDRCQTMDDVLHALEPIWKAAQQATVAGLIADSKDLVAAKDLQRAQALLRKALHIDVGNSQAKTLLEKVTFELRQTEIQPRLKEYMSRGEGFLKAGQIREARSEAEAALGLDSKHEPAKKLLSDVEAAAARMQQLEQKLRLTKQRLAEGALTEAAAALGQALELDGGNPQAQELKRQIDDEKNRREKRKKLSEILHRARTLWTELNYEECLTVLAEALKEFPNEAELLKLRETAQTDQGEQQKQRRMAEVRKLLGQQSFSEARKVLDVLIVDHPQDTAVKNLLKLAAQEEQEQKRQQRIEQELMALRGLLGAGKLKQVVAKGEALLQEYPQDYELKELIAYARGEVTQLEQKKKQEEREKQIQGFMMCERYAEALDAARRGIEEFPKHDAFRKLAAEAEALKKEQDDRDKARVEMHRRVREINSKIGQEELTDAIGLAQQTMETMGQDPNVTQLLHSAEDKRKKKEEQERQVQAVRTLVDKGDHAGATQLFNQVLAMQILHPTDPRAQELQAKLSSLAPTQQKETAPSLSAKAVAAKPVPAQTDKTTPGRRTQSPDKTSILAPGSESARATTFSATKVVTPDKSGARKDAANPSRPAADSGPRIVAPVPGSEDTSGSVVRPSTQSSGAATARPSAQVADNTSGATALPAASDKAPSAPPEVLAKLRRPPVLAGLGAVVLIAIIVEIWQPWKPARASERELKLKVQAQQLWETRQFDQSQQTWRQLAQIKGPLQTEAIQKVSEIEQKRADEQRHFDEGESLLKDKQDYAGAQQAFQDVIQLNLWHADDAVKELAVAKEALGKNDIRNQEKAHFDQGVQLFQNKEYDKARQEFRAALDLSVPDSPYKTEAENYINKIRASVGEQKTFDSAIEAAKAENWAEARDQFNEVINRRGPQSAEAKKQLAGVEKALQFESAVQEALKEGAFRTAKGHLDSSQLWPKTHEKLSRELHSAEQQQFDAIRADAQAAEAKGDTGAIQHAQDQLHGFEGRAVDPGILQSSRELDKHLADAYTKAMEKTGDKAAFDAAVSHFTDAKQAKNVDKLNHDVRQDFQKIANGSGIYKEQAQLYVKTTIPNAIQSLTESSNKVVLPPIACGSGQGPSATPTLAGGVSCAQLDQGAPLQWIGNPMVDFPDVANQPGKLPYTLALWVTVDPAGNVKIDRDGNVDKAFFNKAKDASKHWKTTVPKSGGKPVSVRFPLSIIFRR